MNYSTMNSEQTFEPPSLTGQWWALGTIALSTLLSMSVWFSASFVLPQLTVQLNLSAGSASLLTIAVQLGFVVGAVGAAMSGLADAVPTKILMFVGAGGAAVANLGMLIADELIMAVLTRLLAGMFLAIVYPPALKEASVWFRKGRGLALGLIIGALTIGSALPHGVSAVSSVDWRIVIMATSAMSAAGSFLILLLKSPGPYPYPRSPATFGGALRSLRNHDVALADIGYMGHMWELYAMWATVGAFLSALPAMSNSPELSSGLAFAAIAVGAIGCLVGGIISDRIGRASSARISLMCSGSAALVLGLGFQIMPIGVVIAICAFWGFWVIADSAQFSALVTERADPDYVGGALSLQLALGYLTTILPIWLVPILAQNYSWNIALIVLALGPAVGIWALTRILQLRKLTDGQRYGSR